MGVRLASIYRASPRNQEPTLEPPCRLLSSPFWRWAETCRCFSVQAKVMGAEFDPRTVWFSRPCPFWLPHTAETRNSEQALHSYWEEHFKRNWLGLYIFLWKFYFAKEQFKWLMNLSLQSDLALRSHLLETHSKNGWFPPHVPLYEAVTSESHMQSPSPKLHSWRWCGRGVEGPLSEASPPMKGWRRRSLWAPK